MYYVGIDSAPTSMKPSTYKLQVTTTAVATNIPYILAFRTPDVPRVNYFGKQGKW